MSVIQISLDSIRENQLAEIKDRRPEVPRMTKDAAQFLLFEYMEKILKVKKA